jgi:hypothetical protein
MPNLALPSAARPSKNIIAQALAHTRKPAPIPAFAHQNRYAPVPECRKAGGQILVPQAYNRRPFKQRLFKPNPPGKRKKLEECFHKSEYRNFSTLQAKCHIPFF